MAAGMARCHLRIGEALYSVVNEPANRHSQYATPQPWVHKLLNFFLCFFATPFCDTSDDRDGAADAGADGRSGWGWGRG